MNQLPENLHFDDHQIDTVNQAVTMAEELVSNHFKMSDYQWLSPKYDVKTRMDLRPNEVVDGPFAQIIRYEGKRKGSSLGSESYDFYKICLQDQAILTVLNQTAQLELLPFCLYIITHELIHIVRFSKFLQNFDATPEEKLSEERRVHEITHRILQNTKGIGLESVLDYFKQWRRPIDTHTEP
jgi:hypothetical protein